MEIKALACELPYKNGVPLSRFSRDEIAREAVERGIVAKISGSTVWRFLNEDAIKPWQYRSWIFPRNPDFEEKAGRILDLYQGVWEGEKLRFNDYIISADEKTSIQARKRKHATSPPRTGECMRIEHEYERKGALNYLAAWDVRRAKVFGRCEPKTGIVPFNRLVRQVMEQEPYRSARRVFLVVDNGSSHRGEAFVKRMHELDPRIVPVHLPVHASWLNQIEIYFSIVQRKVLTPNDFDDLEQIEDRILRFEKRYEEIAKPFEWKFTRDDLKNLMAKLEDKTEHLAISA